MTEPIRIQDGRTVGPRGAFVAGGAEGSERLQASYQVQFVGYHANSTLEASRCIDTPLRLAGPRWSVWH